MPIPKRTAPGEVQVKLLPNRVIQLEVKTEANMLDLEWVTIELPANTAAKVAADILELTGHLTISEK